MSKATDLRDMFENSMFKGDVSKWKVSNVKDMSHMFHGAAFNGHLEHWNVGQVENMEKMFAENIHFNQPLEAWNVERVRSMNCMFFGSIFNHPLSGWKVAQVEDMQAMFAFGGLDQELEDWTVMDTCDTTEMFHDSKLFRRLWDQVEEPYDEDIHSSDWGSVRSLWRQQRLGHPFKAYPPKKSWKTLQKSKEDCEGDTKAFLEPQYFRSLMDIIPKGVEKWCEEGGQNKGFH